LATYGFVSGDTYDLRDAQNPLVTVSSGTYGGGTISLPLNLTATIPIYYVMNFLDTNHTPTLFNAFLVTGKSGTTAELVTSASTLTSTNWVGTDATGTSFTVQNTGGGTMSYTISTNVPWVQVNPTNGTSSGEIDTITVTFTGTGALPAGDAAGLVTVTATGATGSPAELDVSNHSEDLPLIVFTPNALQPECHPGEDALGQSFWVSNGGGGIFGGTISDDVAWLSVNPTEVNQVGSASWQVRVDVTYDTDALTPGVYPATITITEPNASNNPQTIPVTLTVVGAPTPPTINLNTATLTPTCLAGNNAGAQVFEIWNHSGASRLNYTITDDQAWLSEAPASGYSDSERDPITVTYATSGLAEGEYSATITATDVNASNNPQTIAVTLTVTNAPAGPTPLIQKDTTTLTPVCYVGSNASSQTVQVWNGNTSTLNYTITDNVTWLSVAPGSGSSTGELDTLTITYSTAALAVGSYTGTITITDGAASNSPQTITVNLTVYPLAETGGSTGQGGLRRYL
jgi:hypothetical protein